MLGIFLIILSALLIWFSFKLLGEIIKYKKYIASINFILKNFFLVFCVILLINLLSWSILVNFSKDIVNQETINLVFKL